MRTHDYCFFLLTTTFGTSVLIEMSFGLVEKFALALIYQIFKLQKILAQFFRKILVTFPGFIILIVIKL